ncbi:MAG: MFS transporter [Dehalococcoidales bacterium]|jgi:MFS family permease
MSDIKNRFTGETPEPLNEGPGGKVISFGFAKTFVSFKNPVYRMYYFSMAGHWSSMNMMIFARNLLVFRISDSAAILGILALANAVPMILLTLPGGVLADRFSKKNIIQICQIISILISAGITIVIFTGYLGPEHPESWWVLVVSGALQGGVMGVMMPARSAIISEIVAPEHLMNAISLNNLGMNVFRVLSPALAGVLVDVVGFWVVYAIMTGMVIVSWAFLLFVPASPHRITEGGGNSLKAIIEGWRYIRSEKTLLVVLLFTAVVMILGAPYNQLLPVFSDKILKVSATSLGVMIAVSGVGAIVGSLILASLTNRKRGMVLFFSVLLLGVALIVFSFSRWWYLSLFVIIFIGMGSTVQMALGNSLVQYYSEAAYRGRVMGFFMLGFGFSSLGAFFAGLLAQGIGAPWAVGSLAIVLVIFTLVLLASNKRIRELD